MEFLSCLYGSERINNGFEYGDGFLSCLYGSEPFILKYRDLDEFLSCLYGSELLDTTFNLLIIKEHNDKKQKNPFYKHNIILYKNQQVKSNRKKRVKMGGRISG